MQAEIKSIKFALENTEVIEIDKKYIGHFLIDGIEQCVRRIAVNSIMKITSCNHFSVSIHKNADGTYNSYQEHPSKFNRLLEHHDIASIYVAYSNGDVEQYYVDWDRESDYYNSYQKTIKNAHGDLCIVIDREKDVTDIFDEDFLNDEEIIDFHWKMYS